MKVKYVKYYGKMLKVRVDDIREIKLKYEDSYNKLSIVYIDGTVEYIANLGGKTEIQFARNVLKYFSDWTTDDEVYFDLNVVGSAVRDEMGLGEQKNESN